MSDEGWASLGVLANLLFGVILLVLGLLLAYFSLKTEVGLVSPRIFTPIGVAVALIGVFMLLSKEA